MKFLEYFNEVEEFPQNIAERGVEPEFYYVYVSNTFLNRFSNLVRK